LFQSKIDITMDKEVIAVVTGASRGAGKGIAIALGESGATVYVTGRSADTSNEFGGSVFETAQAVTNAGGKGIPVILDHAYDKQVEALFERVKQEQERLDILVNNAANASAGLLSRAPFWEKPLDTVELITVGLRSHYVSSYYATPLLIANGKGLMVNTGYYGAVSYHLSPVYGAQKAGSDKMAADMAKELRPYNVAAVSIWMGSLDTERSRVYRSKWPESVAQVKKLESPQFTGRVISALYNSQDMMALSGQALIGAELGFKLGVKDVNGSWPASYRNTLGGPPELHPSLKE
jgi:NAD(P)-dependent dehydrogenase (short-subunit alcohol dehydrogenase family)